MISHFFTAPHFYCTLKRLPLGARPTELWLVSIGMAATVNILDSISTAAIPSATSYSACTNLLAKH